MTKLPKELEGDICLTTGIHNCSKNPKDCELVYSKELVNQIVRKIFGDITDIIGNRAVDDTWILSKIEKYIKKQIK